jgi:histidinol phosphatase-like PHP family hydrolase
VSPSLKQFTFDTTQKKHRGRWDPQRATTQEFIAILGVVLAPWSRTTRDRDRCRPQAEYETVWEEDGWQAAAGKDAHGEEATGQEGPEAGCVQESETGGEEVVTTAPRVPNRSDLDQIAVFIESMRRLRDPSGFAA